MPLTTYTVGEVLTASSLNANLVFAASAPTSRIWLNTHNGYGSSSTKIPRYTTTVVNSGSDITYADSASLGSTFTINTAGMYSITVSHGSASSSAINMGISLNSAQLTTEIQSITNASRLISGRFSPFASDQITGPVSVTFYFAVNDVIRPHHDGGIPAIVGNSNFLIVRVN